MTKPRNYLLNGIADALKEAHEAFNGEAKEVHEALDRATREIACVLKMHNSNMDRERFMRVAGYGTGNREKPITCLICNGRLYPDSSYASGYRHAQPSLHGAAVANA